MKKLLYLLPLLMLFLLPAKADAKKVIDMGEFKLTAYCPCSECSKGYGRHTSTGHTACSRHTIAVDTDVIDYGSKVKIGKHVYTAEDCGSHVNGDHIDIFFDTHEEVEDFGVKYQDVYVIRKKS